MYHQFVGTPISAKTAHVMEEAIQKSISLQPHVRRVEVHIDTDKLKSNTFGYGELEGKMITAQVEIHYEGEVILARLEYDPMLDYPLMKLVD